MRLISLLLATILFFTTERVNAFITDTSHILQLDDSHAVYEISNSVLLFEDQSGRMTIEQVVSSESEFAPGKGDVLKFGFTKSAIWCKFTAKTNSNEKWYLDIGNPSTNEADLYSKTGDGSFEHIKTGNDLKFSEKELQTNELLLPLNIKIGEEKTFYLRVLSNTIVKLPLKIAATEKLLEKNHQKDLGNGIYFGLIFSLCLYNIFVFITIRDITYLYYVIYMAFFAANIAFIKGYSLEFITPEFPDWNHGNYYSAIAILFVVLFTDSFLNTESYAPKARWITFSLIALCIVDVIISIAGMKFEGYILANILAFLSISYVLSIGTFVFFKNFKAASIFLLAFVVISFGITIHILANLSVLSTNFFTENGMLIGSSFEAIILSYAMANKFRILKKEKERTQQLALDQARSFSEELIRSQEEERKRIARELHDSIGQNLSVIKNKVFLLKKEQSDSEKFNQSIDNINSFVGQTIQEVRSISYGLRPYQLDLFGLTHSVKSLVEDVSSSNELKISLSIDSIDEILSKQNEINIYRIVQECLNNILKHAEAKSVNVGILRQEKNILINISDDGKGIQNDGKRVGFGLMGMQERIKVLKGNMLIRDNIPSGTNIFLEIPFGN